MGRGGKEEKREGRREGGRGLYLKGKLAGYKRSYFYFTRQMNVNFNTNPMALVLWQEMYLHRASLEIGRKIA